MQIAVLAHQLAEARRERPAEDILTTLVEAEIDGAPLTDQQVIGFCLLLITGGHETTSKLIANGVRLFASHPEQRDALIAEPERMEGAVEELLRFTSPTQYMARTTTRPVDLHETRMFGVVAAAGDPLADPATQRRVADVFLGVWAGTVENDGLNRLVLHAGLEVRDVVIVRALCQYLRQAGVRFTDAYLADTLHDNAEVVQLIVAYFHARLDPRARATRSGSRRARGEHRRRAGSRRRRGREPRRRSHPARAVAGGGRDGPHQRLPG